MKRSFKLQIFIRLIFITFMIIAANRLIAQQFLKEQVRDQVHQEMARALNICEAKFDHREAFLSCFKALEKGSLISNVSDFYVLCRRAEGVRPAGSFEGCPEPGVINFWESHPHHDVNGTLFYRDQLSDVTWLAVTRKEQAGGPEVWIKQIDVDYMVDQMWALRDRNLVRVVPIVLVLLLLMTFYMTRLMMRPIVDLERGLSSLDASNLARSSSIVAPYREFEKLVKVYRSMQARLNDGFVKARRFASDASHELRTPLTILRGQVEQLIHELPVGSNQQIRIRSMSDEVERLIDITEKLLMLSRADANSLGQKLSRVNLSDLLICLINDAYTFQSSLKITSEIAPDVFWQCDKTLVRQLIQNLYVNAVNYNEPNGWIHIRLRQLDAAFELTIENPSRDTPADLAEHAFDRFYRGDASHTRQVDGLGLGLSICLEIAKLHQANLTLAITNQKTVVATLAGPLHRA
jgi:signal transduction histidine kinase